MSNEIEVGQEWQCTDGTRSRVLEVTEDLITFRQIDGLGGGPQYEFRLRDFRDWHTIAPAPAPAPAPSQHPADLKPRTGKAPLHLIPWAIVPQDFVPEPVLALLPLRVKFPDGDVLEDTGSVQDGDPEEFPHALFCALMDEGTTMPEVAEVFAHGARKYARDNWRSFVWDKSAEDSYFGAIMRHLDADERGETIDPESGLPHRAHAACGCLIWIWHVTRT